MSELSHLHTHKRVGDYVNVATFRPLSIGDAIAKALRGLSAKAIAVKLRRMTAVSARTVESWKQGKRTPRAQHILAMMADDDLCALVLADFNPDLAHQAEIIAAKKKLRELESK